MSKQENDNVNPTIQLKQKITQLTQLRQYDQAKACALQLVKINDKDIEAWFALAQLQVQTGEIEAAVHSYYKVCQKSSPVFLTAIQRSVDLCWWNGLNELGVAPAKQLVKLQPESADAQFKLGAFYFQLQMYLEALPHLLKAHEIQGDHIELLNYCGQCLTYVGRPDDGREYFKRAQKLSKEDLRAYRAALLASNYSSCLSEAQIFEEHKAFGKVLAEQFSPLEGVCKRDITVGDKIRVGYMSADFRSHSCAYFFDVMAKDYSKDRFEVICYSDVASPDGVTEMLRDAVDEWVDCVDLDDKRLAQKIFEGRIDILVDLVGYDGDGRQGVLAQKPSPVQVSYLGYPNTTGLQQVDFRIGDALADPVGQADDLYVEQVVRLEGGFLCYSHDSGAPEVSDLPSAKSGHICFGSFNAYQKLNDRLIEVWAEILKAVPNSTLFMKTRPLADPKLQSLVKEKFEVLGVPADRLKLSGWAENVSSHLELYDQIDIHLDSFPYHGTTTTFEALWQGVPTVTKVGGGHRSRVGLSILERVGLADLAVDSDQDYIDTAVTLAKDEARLKSMRHSLRSSLAQSSLMNRQRFIDEIELAYEQMLRD